MEFDSYVYRWTNNVNGKVYVGVGTKRRAWAHIYASRGKRGYPLAFAMAKYGERNFSLLFLEQGLTYEEARIRERYYIGKLACKTPRGYNQTDGGDGCWGFSKSPETKRKIGLAHKGKKRSPEHAERVRLALLSRSPDVNRKIANSLLGRKRSLESRLKQSESSKGRVFTEEHREALSKAGKGRKIRPESVARTREKTSKLSAAQAENVRFLFVFGARNCDIAGWFGCNPPMISRTLRRPSRFY